MFWSWLQAIELMACSNWSTLAKIMPAKTNETSFWNETIFWNRIILLIHRNIIPQSLEQHYSLTFKCIWWELRNQCWKAIRIKKTILCFPKAIHWYKSRTCGYPCKNWRYPCTWYKAMGYCRKYFMVPQHPLHRHVQFHPFNQSIPCFQTTK